MANSSISPDYGEVIATELRDGEEQKGKKREYEFRNTYLEKGKLYAHSCHGLKL